MLILFLAFFSTIIHETMRELWAEQQYAMRILSVLYGFSCFSLLFLLSIGKPQFQCLFISCWQQVQKGLIYGLKLSSIRWAQLLHRDFIVYAVLTENNLPVLEPIRYYLHRDIQYLIGCFSFDYFPQYYSKLVQQSKLSSNSLETVFLFSINFPLNVCQSLQFSLRSQSSLSDYEFPTCSYFMLSVMKLIFLQMSAFFLAQMRWKLILNMDPSQTVMYIFSLIIVSSRISLVSLYKRRKVGSILSMFSWIISTKVQQQMTMNCDSSQVFENCMVGKAYRICSDLKASRCGSRCLLSQQLFSKQSILRGG